VLADGAARSTHTAGLLRQALDALRHEDVEVKYLTTPAGFHRADLPTGWSGAAGWATTEDDFKSLAADVDEIAKGLCETACAKGRPVRYISLGVDLRSTDGRDYVETSVLYDTTSASVVGVTGKSYPTVQQELTLIRNPVLPNHIVDVDGDRTLTLVCHDLSLFHPRGRAVRRGRRARTGDELESHIRQRGPTIALHQAHTVESPATWTLAWNAVRRENSETLRGWATAFRYLGHNGVQPKAPLSRAVLDGTRGGDLAAIDVVLSSRETAQRLI
jgi:hypothetical protein